MKTIKVKQHLRKGRVVRSHVKIIKTKGYLDSDCHTNSALVAHKNKRLVRYSGTITNKTTGQKLDHSWNVDKKKRIFDITLGSERAKKYTYKGKPTPSTAHLSYGWDKSKKDFALMPNKKFKRFTK